MQMRSRLLDSSGFSDEGVPAWVRQAYLQFRNEITDPGFPCYFATVLEYEGRILYTYVCGDVGQWDWKHLVPTLTEFVERFRRCPEQKLALTVFIEPPSRPMTLDEYKSQFWALLQFLHDNDRTPWPDHEPIDPEDPRWVFHFAGEALFVYCATPAHVRRRTRNYGDGMVVVFQPMKVFDEVKMQTPSGKVHSARIRARMAEWDQVPPHQDLGNYETGECLDWKHLWLPDDNTPVTGPCPLVLRRRRATGRNGREVSYEHHPAE